MNVRNFILLIAMLFMVSCSTKKESAEEATEADDTAAPMTEETSDGVYFVDLKDGDVVQSPVVVNMGVHGMDIEPAGEVHEGKGHHHIIVDGSFMPAGETIPADETHIHYGKGQTADTLALSPGPHTLTLQFANGLHASYGKAWSKTIGITVEGDDM